ncbi:cytochrome c oxidase subunit 3 [Natranaeroarchaeum sulfidigenes]|uniref:Heme/copper-type cytochrome/quinol oxidase, subunit 3 n=1 Tax=Natranaeroarchaeum sulfidigenes TaxID=2784880 RepID=A0A897MN53_9EURY|nr:heme-copper oxidase subunit III [Natranaeroarchaeum sulfidigenes]QSG02024.1 Heme/copper-type cytochrome/quinol oxidase, subunit 3 [Natranaeroarchaeum sulfidigenes]
MTVDDAADDHGHHLPAVKDFPRGFGEASWWPFITAVGGSGFYIAAAIYLLGEQLVGGVTFALSALIFLGGIYGWLYHAFVADFWSREADHKHEQKLRWGMLTFLGSEIATFGALFVYYFFIRVGASWPTGDFSDVPALVNSVVIFNTIILLASSATIHYAHVALLNENRKRFIRLFGLTILLGVIFISGWAFEYYEFIVQYNYGFFEGAFSNGFYALTGLHGIHVALGIVMMSIVFVRALRGQYSAERHVSVSTTSMYWHFVDIVWVFLVVVLYVGAGL